MKYKEKPLIKKILDFEQLGKLKKKDLVDYMIRVKMYLNGIATLFRCKWKKRGECISVIILDLDNERFEVSYIADRKVLEIRLTKEQTDKVDIIRIYARSKNNVTRNDFNLIKEK